MQSALQRGAPARRIGAWAQHGTSMRIRYKVALVGGIPITIAAAIAVIAWLLLSAADRTRNGAVLAGTIYRDLLGAMTERNEYIRALPSERSLHASRLTDLASKSQTRLDALSELTDNPVHHATVSDTVMALNRYRDRMWDLMQVTIRNDRLIAEMAERANSLVELADRARERQHASNANIVQSLSDSDRRLRLARDIVDRAFELQAVNATVALQEARRAGGVLAGERSESARELSFELNRLRTTADELIKLLKQGDRGSAAEELSSILARYEGIGDAAPPPPVDESDEAGQHESGQQRLATWVERLIKIHSTEQRSLHEEVAQLLNYSVNAAETEQATQNIAITILKLGRRTADALATRDVAAALDVLADSHALADTVAALPLSPLVQSEMIDAIASWREGLATTAEGLQGQNEIIADMDATSEALIASAGTLNDLFTQDADRIGQVVRNILLLGAAIGLLLGAGTAFVVARSITEPLRRLQEKMIDLAADPRSGPIAEASRRDELGSMANAVNFFVREIGRREDALRQAKDRADATLAELRETQSNLIQAEKLASLGQLVAGVAHEINTPLGVALTTSTALEREVSHLGGRIESGRLSRSEFSGALSRLTEGSKLLLSNLTRAIDLVYSFKQVAADQASGERRRFDIKQWLDELLTSLGPVLRKSGHEVKVECPSGLMLDTYPGSLAQVLTNLVMNAIVHAYSPGETGRLTISVHPVSERLVRLTFADDGHGIAPEHLGKIFDPFFTTGRDRGGTGLGLHIVYNLVTAKLQGSIDVDSRPGQGTRFSIELPLTVSERAAEIAAARREEPIA
jgi:signal transduction histidine kinase